LPGWMTDQTARAAIEQASRKLAAVSDTPRLDAELLAAYALNLDRETLILNHLNAPEPFGFEELIARRLAHEPVAYITGERDFWDLTLKVGPGVLIPRPDSETLIEAAIAHFAGSAPQSILDLGTGSGALLLAALSHWPQAAGIGVDQSEIALEMAEANAFRLGFGGRSLWRKGDWAEGIEMTFDLILCNPPYVEDDAELAPQVSAHEPAIALFAGPDGLDDYRRLAPQLPPLIADGGCAILEIGHEQAGAVYALRTAQGLKTAIKQDLGGRDRAVIATK
jgi:release factor glutamine methyltransferase